MKEGGARLSEMQQVFAYADDVMMAESGEMKILMSIDTGDFIELNKTGRAIWELVDGTRTLAQIAGFIQDKYSVPAPKCEAELKNFIAGLVFAKLVKQVNWQENAEPDAGIL